MNGACDALDLILTLTSWLSPIDKVCMLFVHYMLRGW